MIFIIKNFVFAYFKFIIRCRLIANQRAYFFVILKNVRKKVKEFKNEKRRLFEDGGKFGPFFKKEGSMLLFLKKGAKSTLIFNK